ncbi:MAG TPA: hypothetical protein PJ991_11100 [Kiritimatiellia bacterium]|nr:hypothetical protein [Kiritimatiellia bacterium]
MAFAKAPGFDLRLLSIAKQNIADLSDFTSFEELTELYELCLASFNRSLDMSELRLLYELADGTATIESNHEEHLWRTAVNIALYQQDRDLDRLLALAGKSQRNLVVPALSVLCMLEPDDVVAVLFFDRLVFANISEHKGFEVNRHLLVVIADGIRQHVRSMMAARLIDYMNRHTLSSNVRDALEMSFGLSKNGGISIQEILETTLADTQNPSSLSAVGAPRLHW